MIMKWGQCTFYDSRRISGAGMVRIGKKNGVKVLGWP